MRFARIVQSAALCLASIALCFDVRSAEADLYVFTGIFPGQIYKFTPDGTQSTFADNRAIAGGLAGDANGNLYEGETGNYTIYNLRLTERNQPLPRSARRILADFDFDSSGNLFTLTFNDIVVDSGVIYKFAPDGSRTIFASGLSRQVNGLAIDAADNVYVGDDQNLSIYKYTSAGVRSTFATSVRPICLAIDSHGNLFESDGNSHTINKFTPDGTQSPFSTASGRMTMDSNDILYVGTGGRNEGDLQNCPRWLSIYICHSNVRSRILGPRRTRTVRHHSGSNRLPRRGCRTPQASVTAADKCKRSPLRYSFHSLPTSQRPAAVGGVASRYPISQDASLASSWYPDFSFR